MENKYTGTAKISLHGENFDCPMINGVQSEDIDVTDIIEERDETRDPLFLLGKQVQLSGCGFDAWFRGVIVPEHDRYIIKKGSITTDKKHNLSFFKMDEPVEVFPK